MKSVLRVMLTVAIASTVWCGILVSIGALPLGIGFVMVAGVSFGCGVAEWFTTKILKFK